MAVSTKFIDYAILLIEDEMPLARAIQAKLQSNGFDTVSARTVEQALDYIKDDVFIEAVWLDHFLLGHKTGIDFLSAIKNNAKFKDIPIFVVANTGGPETQHSYLQLGVTKYYVKSNHQLSEIVEEIVKVIKKDRSNKL